MFLGKSNINGLAVAACLVIAVNSSAALAAEIKLDEKTFAALRTQIRPQPGESRWLEVPWLIDVHEARQRAAAEGKPLFVYSGGGATGIGAC